MQCVCLVTLFPPNEMWALSHGTGLKQASLLCYYKLVSLDGFWKGYIKLAAQNVVLNKALTSFQKWFLYYVRGAPHLQMSNDRLWVSQYAGLVFLARPHVTAFRNRRRKNTSLYEPIRRWAMAETDQWGTM